MEIIREAALLAFLTNENQSSDPSRTFLVFNESFMGTNFSYSIEGQKISARFSLKSIPANFEQVVGIINKSLEIGFFSSKNNEIIYTDTFLSIKGSSKSSYRMIILNHIQKFSKSLKKNFNVFTYFKQYDSKALQIASSLAKLSKEKYVSIVEYSPDKQAKFQEDVEFILRLIQAGLNHLIIPQGSMIRPHRRIKYYLPGHQQALPFKNLSLMNQNSLDLLLKNLENLQVSGFVMKDNKNVRSCSYFLENQVFIIPDKKISKLFHIKTPKNPMNLQILKEKSSIRSKFDSFVDLKLLQNSGVFTIVEIDKNKENQILEAYKNMNLFKNDLIVEFYGIYSDSFKTFAVFEKYCPGNLADCFSGHLRSTQLKIFSNLLVKILDFIEWIQDKPAKDLFFINPAQLSFYDSRLKIVPNIETVKDFSQYPPDDLLFIVLAKNKDFCETFLDLLRYLQVDHEYKKFNLKLLGKALVLQYKYANYCGSRMNEMISQVFWNDEGKEFKKKVLEVCGNDEREGFRTIKSFLNYFFSAFEEIIVSENQFFRYSKFTDNTALRVIFRYFVLKKVKNLMKIIKDSSLMKDIIDPNTTKLIKQFKEDQKDLQNRSISNYYNVSQGKSLSQSSNILSQSSRTLTEPSRTMNQPLQILKHSSSPQSKPYQYSLHYDKLKESHPAELQKITEKILIKFKEVFEENFLPQEIPRLKHESSSDSLSSINQEETLSFNFIENRAENLIKKYQYQFDEATGFAENLLNSQVLAVLKKNPTSGSSDIFMIGRLIYSVLFEEKDKKLNEKLNKTRTNFHKYLKTTLSKRVYFKVTEDESKLLPKYSNLSLMMMNYNPHRRPTRETVLKKIQRNFLLKDNKSEIAPIKQDMANLPRAEAAEHDTLRQNDSLRQNDNLRQNDTLRQSSNKK